MDGEVHSACGECGGKCCKYFCFEIDKPDSFEEFENIRWFLLHEGVSVHVEDGDWYISLANRCQALDAEGRCTRYEDRPLICRQYALDNCDHNGGDHEYDEHFHGPDELAEFARKALGRKAYRKAQEKAYDKAARDAAKAERKRRKRPAADSGPAGTPHSIEAARDD